VPEYYDTGANTFQVEMLYDQTIRISYLDVSAEDGIAGLSAGEGMPPEYLDMDLSELGGCAVPGDLNCDGVLNPLDIDPFILALTDAEGYAAAWPGCNIENADINGDGAVNPLDIDPFIALLTAG